MNVSNKKLEELTMEEWGKLFPIEIIPPQGTWVSVFENEKKCIEDKLTKKIVLDIQHIGSISIPNLASKGSIDMLINISSELLFNEDVIKKMQSLGYEYCAQDGYGPNYMIFAKGFNREGKTEQKYFAHMTPKSHTEIWDRIFFKDYLREHSEIAKEYENLKIELASKFSKDKRNFQKGKTDFVMRVTKIAKEKYTALSAHSKNNQHSIRI